MLKQKKDTGSSSKNPAPSPLSKNEQKLAESWHANIEPRIHTNVPNPESLSTYLARLAADKNGRGALILAHALNLLRSSAVLNINKKYTLLFSTTHRAMNHGLPNERECAREAIKLLLQYGAKINTDGPCPILLLLGSRDITPAYRNEQQFTEILKPFLEYPETFEVKGKYGESIAHMFAMYPCGSLALILAKKPELLNSIQMHGRTPLSIAIECSQTSNALMLINEMKADLFPIVNTLERVLSIAINFKNLPVIQAILKRGAPIETQTNPLLTANHGKEILLELSKAGYFLSKNHFTSCKDLLLQLFEVEANDDDILHCVFTLSSEDGLRHQHIFTDDQLENTDIVPSQAQIKRLHLSFIEVLQQFDKRIEDMAPEHVPELLSALNEGSAPRLIELVHQNIISEFDMLSLIRSLYLQEVFDKFKSKFPLEENVNFIQVNQPTTPNINQYGYESLQAYIYTASLNPNNQYTMESLDKDAKESLKSEAMTKINIEELIPLVEGFAKTTMIHLPQVLIENADNRFFREFFFKLEYRFALKVIPIFLSIADSKQMEQLTSAFLLITSLACNHLEGHNDLSSHKLTQLLEVVADTYESKRVSPTFAQGFRMLACIQKFRIYTDFVMLDGLHECLITINKMIDLFTKKDLKDSLLSMIHHSFYILLDTLKITRQEIANQRTLVESLESIVKTLIRKGVTTRDFMGRLFELIELRTNDIQAEYASFAEELKTQSSPLYEFASMKGKKLEFTFKGSEDEEIDPKRLRSQIKKIDNTEFMNEGFVLNFYGLSPEEIYTAVEQLNKITLDDIKLLPKDESKPVSPASSDEGQNPFTVGSELTVERQVIKKQKNKAPSSSSNATPAQTKSHVSQEEIDRVRAQVRTNLKLSENAELFPIDHPAFPESRKHLCFGLWSEITTKKSEMIPVETIKSHHDLAITGKVVTFAYRQNGLKPSKVIDATTGKYVEGLKTKRSSDDIRIHSAPIKVKLNTQEEVLLYVFGEATDHKQNAPSLDAQAMVSKI